MSSGIVSGDYIAITPTYMAEHWSHTLVSCTLFLAVAWFTCLAVPSSAFWSGQNSGRSLDMSMYSHWQILSASFASVGGRLSPRNVPLSIDPALGRVASPSGVRSLRLLSGLIHLELTSLFCSAWIWEGSIVLIFLSSALCGMPSSSPTWYDTKF